MYSQNIKRKNLAIAVGTSSKSKLNLATISNGHLKHFGPSSYGQIEQLEQHTP